MGGLYRLTSMVCYYGQHYMALIRSRQTQSWLLFDDASVSQVGDWAAVVRKCQAGRIQPSVLFYTHYDVAEVVDGGSAGVGTAPAMGGGGSGRVSSSGGGGGGGMGAQPVQASGGFGRGGAGAGWGPPQRGGEAHIAAHSSDGGAFVTPPGYVQLGAGRAGGGGSAGDVGPPGGPVHSGGRWSQGTPGSQAAMPMPGGARGGRGGGPPGPRTAPGAAKEEHMRPHTLH